MSRKTVHPDMQVIMDAGTLTTQQIGPHRSDVVVTAPQWCTIHIWALLQLNPEKMYVVDRRVPSADGVLMRVNRPNGLKGTVSGMVSLHDGGFDLPPVLGPLLMDCARFDCSE